MTKLQFFSVVYTRGDAPRAIGASLRGIDVSVLELPVHMPTREDDLFGPHVTDFLQFKPVRSFLIAAHAEQAMASEVFFENLRARLLEVLTGVTGYVIDVLRLYPMPITAADQLIPYDVMGDDLFSLLITDRGAHGMHAETFGLAKLGQSELTFDFAGWALKEEATHLVARIADWVFQHRRLIRPGSEVPFGFDTVRFVAADGVNESIARGWHAPFIQKVLPERLFSGTGVAHVECVSDGVSDLTQVLVRMQKQQEVLTRFSVVGDSPHHQRTAQVKGLIRELRNVEGVRSEPVNSRDSGWSFRHTDSPMASSGTISLGELARQVPEVVAHLALPAGSVVWWNAEGRPVTTVSDLAGLEEYATGEFTLGAEK